MKFLAAAAIALAAAPSASGAEPTMVIQDVPVRGRVLAAAAPAQPFDVVGLHWRGTGSVSFRTRSASGRWSAWRTAIPEPEDLPDRGSVERARVRGWHIGNPYWVGASDRIEYRLRGDILRLRAHLIRSLAERVPLRRLAVADSPLIVSRAAWGANEAIRRAEPRFSDSVRFAVVHHTAGSNSYSAAQSAAIVRAVYLYHVRGNGWNDIGYNFLVDKYGQVFEGRYGGVERNVIGAHAEGFNTGSTGIAVLGNYGSADVTPEAEAALQAILSWRLDVAHVDPLSSLTWTSGGNGKFPAGQAVSLRAVSGHRDTGATSCPGPRLYAKLGALAAAAAGGGQPKLYDPAVRGSLGGQVRFSGRLSTPLGWNVSVTDEFGSPVASGSGSGTAIDWTWDARGAARTRYLYEISAGAQVRPARGTIGTSAQSLTVTGAVAAPITITPNGDSRADRTTISYTLSQPATVSVTLHELATGRQLATLFSESRGAGRHSFAFGAEGVRDGVYLIVLRAVGRGGRDARAEVRVIVDRTLAGFAAQPRVFSPNGDSRNDEMRFTFVLTAWARAKLEIRRGKKTVAVAFSGLLPPQSHELMWKGRRRLADGEYEAVLSVDGPLGTRVQTATFASDLTRPRLRILSVARLRFWVSERVTLIAFVDGRSIVQEVRAGRVRLSYPFAVKRVRARAWDAAGNASSLVSARR